MKQPLARLSSPGWRAVRTVFAVLIVGVGVFGMIKATQPVAHAFETVCHGAPGSAYLSGVR